MTKKLLTGLAAALFLAVSSAAYADIALPEADAPNYEPGIDGSQWGMQAPVGWNAGEEGELPAVGNNTIESIRFEDQPTYNGGFLFIPPDPHCAVGPNHIITIVNCTIQWYAKTGGAAQNIQPLGKQTAAITNSFFNSLNPINALFDPKVIYDRYNGRFIVVALEQAASPTNVSRTLFAVSDDNDPNGTWYYYALNTMIVISAQNAWLDYPGLACDANHIYLTGNYFNFAGTAGFGSRLWILNKAPFYAGGAATGNPGNPFDAATLSGGFPNSTMMPAEMYGTPPAGVGTYLCMYSGLSDGTNEYFQTIRVDNPAGVPVFTGDQALMGNIDNTAAAFTNGIQPTSTSANATRINTNDRRCLQALWRNGHVYAVFQTNPNAGNPNATQSTAYWLKEAITTGAGTVVDGGYIGGEDVAAGSATFFPSIAVDRLGNIAVGLGICSPVAPIGYASAAYTTRSAADPAGFMNPLTVFASGQAFYKRTFSSSTNARNRWGDYTGTVVDPDDCMFWSYNEYAGTQGTPTTIGGVTEQGRWWTRAASYFVDDNRNGNPDGCEPVAVVLSKFEAVRDGVAGVINWSVAEEHDHLGFNVYRETEGGARVIIHEGLLTGNTDYSIRDEDAPAGGAKYWLQEVDRSGKSHWIGSIDLAPASAGPALVALGAARPNPFNQSTSVQFSLGSSRQVNVSVYDVQGRRVSTLVDGIVDAGDHTATWNGRTDDGGSATSGFYFVKLQTAGQVKVVKVVLARGTASN